MASVFARKETMKKQFAYKPAQWVYDIEDKKVWSAVSTLLFDHQVTGESLTEESLKKEIAEFDDLSEAQAQEVFDLIVAHKD